jgi:hypothetical protein
MIVYSQRVATPAAHQGVTQPTGDAESCHLSHCTAQEATATQNLDTHRVGVKREATEVTASPGASPVGLVWYCHRERGSTPSTAAGPLNLQHWQAD